VSGTYAGGKKAAAKNKELYGDDFYRSIGAKGGANSNTGGFAKDPTRARSAGTAGGKKSRHGHKFLYEKNGMWYYRVNATGEIVSKQAI
jgi:general stress protein YciG